MREWATSHRPVVRRARREAITGERVCDGCGQTKPLDLDHFPLSTKKGGKVWLRRLCRECWRKHQAVARDRYRAKVAADPVRRARELEDARIRAALQRERQTGRLAPRARHANVPNAYREDMGGGSCRIDAGPLSVWLEVVVRREIPDYSRSGGDRDRNDRSRTFEDLAAELGVSARRLWSVRHRKQPWVAASTVDKCVTNYAGVVCGDEMAAVLEERCRQMPGNGERLLRYIDAAEDIAHLCGLAVWRPADLYPALDEAL